jgi:hypothetical protein
MLILSFSDSMAEKARIPFMEDVDNPIAVDGTPALTDLIAAGRARLDVLCDGLSADRTDFHEAFLLRSN